MKNEKNFYKAKAPFDTIQNIREILYCTGVFLTEFSGSHGDFYHSHVALANKGLPHLSISTNGKGRDAEYSLASAYAEMMERLQNSFKLNAEEYALNTFVKKLPQNSEFVLRLKQRDLILDFIYFPDEQEIVWTDLLRDEKSALFQLLKQNASYLKEQYNINNKSVTCVPYFNVFDNKAEYFPVKNWMTGTNGMCAGNSPEEAIVQGLGEIFERFAIRKIWLEDIKPPEIPLETFKGTDIYNRIKKLKKAKNIEVIIFDCSLDMGLPVIGALLIYKNYNKYSFEFAGSANPIIALERCLTEHFQANNPEEALNEINKYNILPGRNEKEIKYVNVYYQFKDRTGELNLPIWLQKEASYKFTRLVTIKGVTHKEELKNITKLIKSLNFEMYIRDNSILGFPTYHIIIPGMSEVVNLYNEDDLFNILTNNDNTKYLLDIKSQPDNLLKQIAEAHDKMYDKVRTSWYNYKGEFLYNTSQEIEEINLFLFTATLFYKIGDLVKSLKNINRYITYCETDNTDDDLTYFYAVSLFLELKIENKNIIEIHKFLLKLYTEEMVNEVMEDMSSPEKALQYYDLPTCFECEKCPIKQDCKYFDVMDVVKKIHNNMRKDIKQLELKKLFK